MKPPLNEVMAERITYEFLGESSGAHAGRLAEVCAAELKLLCEVVRCTESLPSCQCIAECACGREALRNALTALRKQLEAGK